MSNALLREAFRPAAETDAAAARVGFLTYLSRSGSTLLARMLDSRAGIRVSLEARLPDGIVRRGLPLRSQTDVAPLLDHLYADPKFREWKLDRERLRERLEALRFPSTYRHVLEVLLEEHLPDPHCRLRIHKRGFHTGLIRLQREFPGAPVIFVARDPRAIYSSQRQARDSRTGRPMAPHPGVFAWHWRSTMAALARQTRHSWFHVVRYEDLLQRPKETMSRLLRRIDCPGAPARNSDYARRIPQSQQHLHRLVGGTLDRARIDAWRHDLSGADLSLIEAIAGRELERWGYEPAAPTATAGDSVATMLRAGSKGARYAMGRISAAVRTRLG